MELSYKQFTLEVKNLQEDGSFEGYVAAFNNIDFGNDILDSKAFMEEPNGKYYPLLADHDTKKAIGKYQIEFDDYGVKFKNAKFNLMRDNKTGAFLVPLAAEKYANLKNGDISGFSMGYMTSPSDCEYKTIDSKRCRVIKKAQLMEGSVVTFPMNDKARLTAIKTVNPTLNFPLAPRDYEWDASEAEKRIREYTESENEPAGSYQKYFMYFDAGRSKFFDAYKLPFVDIIDGEPHIVPRAVFAIAGVLEGARVGVAIDEQDKAKIKEIINNLYVKMAKEFNDPSLESPLKGKSLEDLSSIREVESILKDNGFSPKEAKIVISKIKEFSREEKNKENEEKECDVLFDLVSQLKTNLEEIELLNSIKNLQNILTKFN
jgi:HK97 family phage prohead protease